MVLSWNNQLREYVCMYYIIVRTKIYGKPYGS